MGDLVFRPQRHEHHGIAGNSKTGKVTSVTAQAERLGVELGWRLVGLNGNGFSDDQFRELMNGPDNYTITFQKDQRRGNDQRADAVRETTPNNEAAPSSPNVSSKSSSDSSDSGSNSDDAATNATKVVEGNSIAVGATTGPLRMHRVCTKALVRSGYRCACHYGPMQECPFYFPLDDM